VLYCVVLYYLLAKSLLLLLLSPQFGYDPLQIAAQCGHLDIVQFLVKRGIDVTVTNKASSLHIA
jgi:Ankyrin repeats (many copies)